MGLSNGLSCVAGCFSLCLNPHRCLQSEVLSLHFPALKPWVVGLSCSPVVPPSYPQANVRLPGPPATALPSILAAQLPISTLLPVWVSVSSLTPWLSGFHTVRFSGSSGWFLFLNLLLSFFWLCEEAWCVYLCLHLGWKSPIYYGNFINFTLHSPKNVLYSAMSFVALQHSEKPFFLPLSLTT